MSHHETIHSRHILQLTLLANICVNIAVRTTSNNQTRGVLKAWLAGKKLQIDTELWFFLERCWFGWAGALHCCTLSDTLFVVFLVLWSCNKQNMRTEPYPRLEKHADDGHHRKSSVSDFGIKLFGFLSRVRSGQHLESKVSSIRSTSWGLFLGDLAESHVGQDLTPSSRVGILGLSTTHINQQNNK